MTCFHFVFAAALGLALTATEAMASKSDALKPAKPMGEQGYRSLSGSGQYRKCLGLLNVDPDKAYDLGVEWRDQGGGPASYHCVALALIALGHYDDGALRLKSLSNNPNVSDELRVEILGQAANAWLLEGEGGRAISDLDMALAFQSETELSPAHLLYDRARAHVLLGDWKRAANDLTVAIGQQAGFLNAFVLRATAHRMLGDTKAAYQDVEAALALEPDHAGALLERGLLRAAEGKKNEALLDLANAATFGKGNEVSEAANLKMKELGFGKDPKPTAIVPPPSDKLKAGQ